MKMVVIDDNAEEVELLRMAFSPFTPFEITQITNGLAAMENLAGQNPRSLDLVIVDRRLPGLPGEEVAKHLLTRQDWDARTPVVVLSSAVPEQTRAALLELGAIVLEKPADLDGYDRLAHLLVEIVRNASSSTLARA